MQIEYHAFGSFLPENVNYLIVGTFPGKKFTQMPQEEVWADETAWSYAGKNQLWRILETIYQVELPTRSTKQALLTELNIGLMDLIQSCARKDNSNLDNNLIDITWNKPAFEAILAEKDIKAMFCTGKGVAVILKRWFPTLEEKIVALPSPSPRYANMSFEQKKAFYEQVFPKKVT